MTRIKKRQLKVRHEHWTEIQPTLAELMVQVVNKSQQVYQPAMSPKAEYSRSVAVMAPLDIIEARGYAYTPVVGNTFWLLRVQVWFEPEWTAAGSRIDFTVRAGIGTPQGFNEMNNWQEIVPVYTVVGGVNYFSVLRHDRKFDFSMRQLFKGDNKRLGLRFETSPAINELEGFAVFEISEG